MTGRMLLDEEIAMLKLSSLSIQILVIQDVFGIEPHSPFHRERENFP